MRHDVFWALRSYRAGAKVVVTDVCVPISRLAECVAATKEDIERSGLLARSVGHVGDGNFHASVILMMEDPHEVAATRAFIERVAERSRSPWKEPAPGSTGLVGQEALYGGGAWRRRGRGDALHQTSI